jgi:hypothetical protein
MCLLTIYIYVHDRSAYILLQEICEPIPGFLYIADRHMDVEIGTEATQFLEKEYIKGIFFRCSAYKCNLISFLCVFRG